MIKIKPLSVNQAWQGKRYKTKLYKQYELKLLSLLPNIDTPIDEKPLKIEITVAYSNKASDIDNFLKPFLDILQKKYKFNDSLIYKMIITKVIVKKGGEYIDFLLDYL